MTEAVAFSNSGTNTTTFAPSTGSIVATGEGEYGWCFGAVSYEAEGIPMNLSLWPATYVARMDLRGLDFSSTKVVWATNGQLFGGYALCVEGNSTDGYVVKVIAHSQGGFRDVYMTHAVPTEKATGLHTYLVTAAEHVMRLYVDGENVAEKSGITLRDAGHQNTKFAFGRLSNVGENVDRIPTGLVLDDFKVYDKVFDIPDIHYAFEGYANDTGTAGVPINGEAPGADDYRYLREGEKMNQGFTTVDGRVHPHSGANDNVFGDGNAVSLLASLRSVATPNSVLFTVGAKNANPQAALGLFSGGENEVFVGEITGGTLTRLLTATVEGATTMLHHYAMTYDKSAHTAALYVDGVKIDKGASDAEPTVEPGASFQLGSIYGGLTGGAVRTSGIIFEDFAAYREILAADVIAARAAEFPPYEVVDIPTLTGAGEVAWTTVENWSGRVVPTAGEAVVKATGDMTLTFDTAVELSKISFMAENAATITLKLGAETSPSSDLFTVCAPAALRVVWDGATLPFARLAGDGLATLGIGANAECILGDNRDYTGNLTLVRGTFKYKPGLLMCLGANTNNRSTTAHEGATIDFNGMDNFSAPIVFNGGTVANTGNDLDPTHVQLVDMTFSADGAIKAERQMYSIAQGYAAFDFNLAGHTLTKTGAGDYCPIRANYSGSGTVKVAEGAFEVRGGTIAAEATLVFDVDAAATLKFTSHEDRALIVDGRLILMGSGSVSGAALPTTFTLRPNGTDALTFVDVLVTDGAEKTITLDDSVLESLGVRRAPLLKVAEGVALPAKSIFGHSGKWQVMATEDGQGYEVHRRGFSITVR